MSLGGDFFSLMTSPLFRPTIRTSPPTISRESKGAPGASMNRVTNRAERELSAKSGVLLALAFRRLTPDIQLQASKPEAATLNDPLDAGKTWAVAVRPLSRANRENIGMYRMSSPLDSISSSRNLP